MPNINSFYEWLNRKGTHTDDLVEIKLTNIKNVIPGTNRFSDEKVEWDSNAVMNDLGMLFKSVPFFSILPEEKNQAYAVMDNFIRDHYKGTPELEAYLGPQDKIPEDIEKTFLSSELRRPWWNILLSLNQNKMASCQLLEQPIPGVPDLDLAIWSGAKVKTPFVTELNIHYKTIILRGKARAIDGFVEVYKSTNKKLKV